MSLSDRRSFLFGALALLPACGFTPVYGPGGTAEGLRGKIDFADPDDRLDFVLVGHLEERLGLPSAPRFNLLYDVTTSTTGLAISNSNNVERVNLSGRLAFSLVDEVTGGVVATGEVENFTSYATTVSTVSTRTAEKDAQDRLMRILGDMLVARLLATAPTWA